MGSDLLNDSLNQEFGGFEPTKVVPEPPKSEAATPEVTSPLKIDIPGSQRGAEESPTPSRNLLEESIQQELTGTSRKTPPPQTFERPTPPESNYQRAGRMAGEAFDQYQADPATAIRTHAQVPVGVLEGAWEVANVVTSGAAALPLTIGNTLGKAASLEDADPMGDFSKNFSLVYQTLDVAKFFPEGSDPSSLPEKAAREFGKTIGSIGGPSLVWMAGAIRRGKMTKEASDAIWKEIIAGNHKSAKSAIEVMKAVDYVAPTPLPRHIKSKSRKYLQKMYDATYGRQPKGMKEKIMAGRYKIAQDTGKYMAEEGNAIAGEMAAANFGKFLFGDEYESMWHGGLQLTNEVAGSFAVPFMVNKAVGAVNVSLRTILQGIGEIGPMDADSWGAKVEKWFPQKYQDLIDRGVDPNRVEGTAEFIKAVDSMPIAMKEYIREAYTVMDKQATQLSRQALGPDASEEQVEDMVSKFFYAISSAHNMAAFNTLKTMSENRFSSGYVNMININPDRILIESEKNMRASTDALSEILEVMPGADANNPIVGIINNAREYMNSQMDYVHKQTQRIKFQEKVDVSTLMRTLKPGEHPISAVDPKIVAELGLDEKAVDEILGDTLLKNLDEIMDKGDEVGNLAQNVEDTFRRLTLDPELATVRHIDSFQAGYDEAQRKASQMFDRPELGGYNQGTSKLPTALPDQDLNVLLRDLFQASEKSGIDPQLLNVSKISAENGKAKYVKGWLKNVRSDAVDQLDDVEAVRLFNETHPNEAIDFNDLQARLDDPETSWEAQGDLKLVREEILDNYDIDLDPSLYEIPLKDARAVVSSMNREAFKMRSRSNTFSDQEAAEMNEIAGTMSRYFDAAIEAGQGDEIIALKEAVAGWKEFAGVWKSQRMIKAMRPGPTGDRKLAPTKFFESTFLTKSENFDYVQAREMFDEAFPTNTPERENAVNLLKNAFREKLKRELGTKELTPENVQRVLGQNLELTRQFGDLVGNKEFVEAASNATRASELTSEVASLSDGIVTQSNNTMDYHTSKLKNALAKDKKDWERHPLFKMEKAGDDLKGEDVLRSILPEFGGNINNLDSILEVADNPDAAREAIRGIVFENVLEKTLDPSGSKFTIVKGELKDLNELNSEVLHKFLTQNEQVLGRLFPNPGELENLKALDNLVRFMARNPDTLTSTGFPMNGITIEGLLSRGYAISRGVVSPRFIVSEMMIRHLRRRKGTLILEAATDPELAGVLKEIVIDGAEATFDRQYRLAAGIFAATLRYGSNREAEEFKKEATRMLEAGEDLIGDSKEATAEKEDVLATGESSMAPESTLDVEDVIPVPPSKSPIQSQMESLMP